MFIVKMTNKEANIYTDCEKSIRKKTFVIGYYISQIHQVVSFYNVLIVKVQQILVLPHGFRVTLLEVLC